MQAVALLISTLLFLIFAVNVFLGATNGKPFMGDVGEMMVLFAASAVFVVAILKKEADRDEKNGG